MTTRFSTLNFQRSDTLSTIKTIVVLAWPIVAEQLMQTTVQYIDTAMVGSLGTHATAAVGATGSISFLLFSVMSALGVAFLAHIARACGAGDQQRARALATQALVVVLVSGTLLTVIPLALSSQIPVWVRADEAIRDLTRIYFIIVTLPILARAATIILSAALRAAGDTQTPMKAGIVVNLVNVCLNFLLIYPTRPMSLLGLHFTMPGAGLGVVGAAIASAIAFVVGGVLITLAFWKHPMLSPRGLKIRPNREILLPCLKTALPNILQRFGVSMGFVAFGTMINSLGQAATAANTIANTVEQLFYIPGFGMQTAASTLIGNAYGARDSKLMKRYASLFMPIEVGIMFIAGLILFLTAPALVDLFSDSPEVISMGSTVLRMVAVSEPFYGFSIITEGFMFGVGKTKAPFIYNIIGMWCVRIVGTYICTQILGMGLISVWACMIAHNMVIFCIYVVIYTRSLWNPLRE